ncbi:type II toxin-antitoxin system Phd/YefM family antitoxin [Arthrobacter monumenti]
MGQYNVQDAKTRFSELLQLVERGDEVIIARSGHPVAKLVKLERPAKRALGFLGLSSKEPRSLRLTKRCNVSSP